MMNTNLKFKYETHLHLAALQLASFTLSINTMGEFAEVLQSSNQRECTIKGGCVLGIIKSTVSFKVVKM